MREIRHGVAFRILFAIIYPTLRSLYQIDRTACAEVDERSGSDIEVWHRLQWVADARAEKMDHVSPTELEKYLVSLFLVYHPFCI